MALSPSSFLTNLVLAFTDNFDTYTFILYLPRPIEQILISSNSCPLNFPGFSKYLSPENKDTFIFPNYYNGFSLCLITLVIIKLF